MRKFKSSVCSAAIVAVTMLNAIGPAAAGPLPFDSAIKRAAAGDVTDVRYYHNGGAAFAAALALGLIGTAIASQYYYYPPAYYYYPPPPPYYYAPYGYWGGPRVFYHPRPIYRFHGVRHWHYRHR
jgi:hypothetical protein